MSMIERGAIWLRGVQKESVSTPVTVKRGGDEAIVDAVTANVQDNAMTLNGVVTGEWRTHFIIAVDEYDFGSGAVKPDFADEFVDQYGDTYTCSRDDTDVFWRYADESKLAYRIYTSLYEDVS